MEKQTKTGGGGGFGCVDLRSCSARKVHKQTNSLPGRNNLLLTLVLITTASKNPRLFLIRHLLKKKRFSTNIFPELSKNKRLRIQDTNYTLSTKPHTFHLLLQHHPIKNYSTHNTHLLLTRSYQKKKTKKGRPNRCVYAQLWKNLTA